MKSGFTLIEIAIVIAIIGVMMSLITPSLFRKNESKAEAFIDNLNALTSIGVQNSIREKAIQKITFDLQDKKITLENISGAVSKTLTIPAEIDITDFSVNKKSAFSIGATKLTAYFFIDPEGYTQEINLQFQDLNNNKTYNLYLNPFSKKFKIS